MTPREQVAVWLDELGPLDDDPLYPGYTRTLCFPTWPINREMGTLIEEIARERGWWWTSLSYYGISFMYRADLLEAEEQAAREAEAEGYRIEGECC